MIRNLDNTAGKVFLLSVVLVLILFGFMVNEAYSFGVDDSFIFYRYAENIAQGHGFVFNVGEAAGEGFTSWTWTLLLAIFHLLGFNLVPVSKIVGILFHVSASVMVFLVAGQLISRTSEINWPWVPGILSAVYLLNFRLTAHSVSGMETSLYIFSILLLVYFTTRALQTGDVRWWLMISLAATFVFCVRPEGLAVGGISLLALLVTDLKALSRGQVWLYVSLGLVLPVILFFLIKLAVFGYVLPHSYYHKVIVNQGEYGASLQHLLRFVKSYWWLIAASGFSSFYAIFKEKKKIYFYYGVLFLAMVGLYLFFYPAMNYLHRFYIPYLPLLLIMLVPLLQLPAAKLRQWGLKHESRFPGKMLRPVSFLLILGFFIVGMNTQLKSTQQVMRSWAQMVNPEIYRAKLGRMMSILPKELVVANAEMGVIPYYSGLTCIDMAGLTDPHIAHHGLTMAYLEQRGVGLILFPRDMSRMTGEKWLKYTINYKDVFLSERFRRDFQCLGSFAAWPGRKTRYYLYADRTSRHFDVVRQTLGNKIIPFETEQLR